ncbi:hypothetical protein [Niallia taxi]|uniref:hypothetical protein n=1 Tax=Niallia taxi TaxID=2499688 RepID=UPI002E1FB171|nr:hypothetical protein [Niallia taxi]
MKKGQKYKHIDEDKFLEKTKESKLLYTLGNIDFIEGIYEGEVTRYFYIRFHNGADGAAIINPEIWEDIAGKIEAEDNEELWNMFHSWGIYAG